MVRKPKPIELSFKDREDLLERLKQSNLSDKDRDLMTGLVEFNLWLQYSLEEKKISISKLQKMFGHSSEKRSHKKKQKEVPEKQANQTQEESASNDDTVTENASDGDAQATDALECEESATTDFRRYASNTGRLSHEAYTHAEVIFLDAPYKEGDVCSELHCTGRLKTVAPGNVIKVVGQSFAKANKYVLQTLRCNLCEKYFKSKLPDNVCSEKYDPVFKAQLCVHKYFLGVPHYRLEAYQKMIGVPLPDSTQLDKTEEVANDGYPAFKHLETLAANGNLVQGDDTTVRIKSIMQGNGNDERKGAFTTGILAFNDKRRIHLFYNGRKHCGENMALLLEKRDPKLPEIQYMCDALSRNMPASLKATLINCLVHGRRNFIDIEKFYPDECSAVIEVIGAVYANDAEARKQNLDDSKRLAYHQKHSATLMEDLKNRLHQGLEERWVESNSALGKAYHYMLKHWHKLTQFLRIPGAPLDNNTLEQALKIPIRVRKNSYFYATEQSAYIGGVLQSLICTAMAAKENPVDYLTALQVHKTEVRLQPGEWMPWNYKATLEKLSSQPPPTLAQVA